MLTGGQRLIRMRRQWGGIVMLVRIVLWCVLFATAAPAATLDRIAESGVLRMGVRADAPPLSYLRDGAESGYSVAVCKRLAERLADQMGRAALTVEPVVVSIEERFSALADGRIDILCGAASVTLARRAEVDFSIPIYIDGASVLMRSGETVDFAALANRRIGVRAGTTTERNLMATLDKTGMVADVVTVAEHAEGVARLLGRDVDAYFADQSILLFLMVGSGRVEELTLARNVLTIEPQALALPPGDGAFRLEVDRALSRMYRAGEIAALFEENFAPATMGDAMKALTLIAPIPE